MKVCEHELKCCPYCGEDGGLIEEKRLNPNSTPPVHAVVCGVCGGIFYLPCVD